MDPNVALKSVMTENVICLHFEDSLNIVNKTFEKHTFHHIPIVETGGAVVGMISKEDLLRLLSIRDSFSEKEFRFLKVRDFMARNILTLAPDDSVGLAADIFMANKFHAIPVVEMNKIVGIITTHDLIGYAFKQVISS